MHGVALSAPGAYMDQTALIGAICAGLQRLTRREAAKLAATQQNDDGGGGDAATPGAVSKAPAAAEEAEEVSSCAESKQHARVEQAAAAGHSTLWPSHQCWLLWCGSLLLQHSKACWLCRLSEMLSSWLQGVDAYDISDPVDILPDLRGFDDEVANTAKWSLRRDVLIKLKTLAGACQQPSALQPEHEANPHPSRTASRHVLPYLLATAKTVDCTSPVSPQCNTWCLSNL